MNFKNQITLKTYQYYLSENFLEVNIKRQKSYLSTLLRLFLVFIFYGFGTINAYAFENFINSNNTQTATLTLVKTVFNSHGGNAVISDFGITTSAGSLSFTITSSASNIGLGGNIAQTTTYTSDPLVVNANTSYSLRENDRALYAEGNWNCSNGDTGAYNSTSVTLNESESVICTIVNNDRPTATLSLNKTVINNNNGTTTDSDWVLSAIGPTTISGVEGEANITVATVASGVYTLSERGGSTAYQFIGWTCSAGILIGNQLTLTPNDVAVCTSTSDDIEQTNIPTLSEWMLILLSLLLLTIGKTASNSHQHRLRN